ncbi:MAG: HAD family hydrolase [Massiliimalia sp.]
MIRLIGFDLDGTLLDSLPDLTQAINYGLESVGLPVHSQEETMSFIGNGAKVMIHKAVAPLEDDAIEQKVRAGFDQYYGKHFYDRSRLFPGVKELLDFCLRYQIQPAVLSNKPDEFVKLIIKTIFPDNPFGGVMGQSDRFPKKPDPAAFFQIQKDLGMVPEQCVYVGDSDVDILLAKNAGVFSIGVTWGYRPSEELIQAGADLLVDHPSQIIDFLKKQNQIL